MTANTRLMTDILFEKAFDKAEKVSGKESMNARAEFLAEYILEKHKFSVSSKSLIRYYRNESSPGEPVRKFVSLFLGYQNYEEFVFENSKPNEIPKPSIISKSSIPFARPALIIFLVSLPIIGISAFVGYTGGKEKCMTWNNDHYIETNCTGAKSETAINSYLIDNFKKIKVSDTTTFYKNEEVQVWYDKSNKQLEFFTSPGLHPENGKTLKPVSQYIIDKYIKN